MGVGLGAAPFRFMQAAGVHLDRPLTGLSGLPQALQQVVCEARYRAAEKLFAAAISERVDFLILAGAVCEPGLPGSRAPWFLADQFRALAERGIQVFWAEAPTDVPTGVRQELQVANGVHCLFPTAAPVTITRTSDGQPLARMFVTQDNPSSLNRRAEVESVALPTIAVAPEDKSHRESLQYRGDYCVRGGGNMRPSIQHGNCQVVFCGSIQAGSQAEMGVHGALLTSYQPQHPLGQGARFLQERIVATESVRWRLETLEIHDDSTWEALGDEMQARVRRIQATEEVPLVLVNWLVQGHGPMWDHLLHEPAGAELLARLRNAGQPHRYAPGEATALSSASCVWSLQIESQWNERQTEIWKQHPGVGTAMEVLQELTPHFPLGHQSRATKRLVQQLRKN